MSCTLKGLHARTLTRWSCLTSQLIVSSAQKPLTFHSTSWGSTSSNSFLELPLTFSPVPLDNSKLWSRCGSKHLWRSFWKGADRHNPELADCGTCRVSGCSLGQGTEAEFALGRIMRFVDGTHEWLLADWLLSGLRPRMPKSYEFTKLESLSTSSCISL